MKSIVVAFFIFLIASQAVAQSLSDVPGVPVYWRNSPATFAGFALSPNRIYTASPSIAKLDNGDYLITFNLFGGDMSPDPEDTGITYIYRSSDGGNTWTQMPSSPMSDLKRGSLFVRGGNVYLWGYRAAPGEVVIYKSTDNGATWSPYTELSSTPRGGTPFNPVFMPNHNGVERIWCAVGGRRIMSGRVDNVDFLMDANRWSNVSANAQHDEPDFGSGVVVETISEAQIVGAPDKGIFVLPKVEMSGVSAPYFSYTILQQSDPNSNNAFVDASQEEWVALPGAEKKFGAAYDPVSEKFYVLSNPVLPAHESGSGYTWQLIRNTAALISSKDLYHWDVEQLFLYSPHVDYEGFQYLNFDYDGDDMIVASRTAFDITNEPGISNRPPRGHDSNMITFHRIGNFRSVSPNYYLTFSGNNVLRNERSQYADAPLGRFVLGNEFDGSPLGTVTGIGQDVDGDVYINEQGVRILRFDALGNFKQVVTSSPVAFQTGQVFISAPAHGERAYMSSGGGNWKDLHNWFYWGRPDTDYEVANLGSAITANRNLTMDKVYTMKGIRFRSVNRYTLDGAGGIEIKAENGNGVLEAYLGNQRINVGIVLESNTDGFAENDVKIRFNGAFDINGKTLHKRGAGLFEFNNNFILNGGAVIVDGLSPLTFVGSANTNLNGTLTFEADASLSLTSGAIFQLLDGVNNISGTFQTLNLPTLAAGLNWDDSMLYTEGTVEITGTSALSADFEWTDTPCGGSSVVFTATDSEATSWEWKVNDQTEATGSATFEYTFPAVAVPTEFQITLIVGNVYAVQVQELTVIPSSTVTNTESACDTYTWAVNNTTYTESGFYSVLNGCETQELDLTVTTSSTVTTTETACGSYTWAVNGTTYTESDTYTVQNGCETHELVLTITPPTTVTTTETACGSYTWAVNGTTYTESDTYTVQNGCETQELVLTITTPTSVTTTESACGSYTWAANGTTYTESDTYTVVNGCQTQELVLTVNPSPQPSIVDVNGVLSTQDYASVQWSLDGVPIDGATGQTYVPTAAGAYTVAVTDNAGCDGVSAPFDLLLVSVQSPLASGVLTLMPNPTSGMLFIQGLEGDTEVEVLTVDGRLLFRAETRSAWLDLTDVPSGTYLLRINGTTVRFVRF